MKVIFKVVVLILALLLVGEGKAFAANDYKDAVLKQVPEIDKCDPAIYCNQIMDISEDGEYFFQFVSNKLYAFDSSYNLLWTYTFEENTAPFEFNVTTDDKGNTYVPYRVIPYPYEEGPEGGIIALNPHGVVKWVSKTAVASQPVFGSDGTVYYGSGNRSGTGPDLESNLYAIHPDGSVKWKKKVNGDVLAGDLHYDSSSDQIIVAGIYELAAFQTDGSVAWRKSSEWGPSYELGYQEIVKQKGDHVFITEDASVFDTSIQKVTTTAGQLEQMDSTSLKSLYSDEGYYFYDDETGRITKKDWEGNRVWETNIPIEEKEFISRIVADDQQNLYIQISYLSVDSEKEKFLVLDGSGSIMGKYQMNIKDTFLKSFKNGTLYGEQMDAYQSGNSRILSLNLREQSSVLDNYTRWDDSKIVDPNHTFKVTFNTSVQPVTNNQVFVEDAHGVRLPVNVQTQGKTVSIQPPSDLYVPGQHYTLSIQNVASEEGEWLQEAVQMEFSVQ